MRDQLTINVGGVPEHFNLPWILAIEEGAFERLGVGVHFQEFGGGTGAMAAALDRREIDLAMLLTEGCLAEQLNGSPICIVKSFVTSPLIWGIHVAASSDLLELGQIQDRRYAISRFGSGSHLMAIVDAAERGWATDSLHFVPVEDLVGARNSLARGESDVFFWEQVTTDPYVQAGEFRRLGNRSAPWPAFVVAANSDFVGDNAHKLRQVLSIINQYCQRLMRAEDTVGQVAERYGLRKEQVEEWFQRTRWSDNFRVPKKGLLAAFDYLRRLRLIPAEAELGDLSDRRIWWRL
jgi:sulfonate transport system substrate-binding protein